MGGTGYYIALTIGDENDRHENRFNPKENLMELTYQNPEAAERHIRWIARSAMMAAERPYDMTGDRRTDMDGSAVTAAGRPYDMIGNSRTDMDGIAAGRAN